MATPIARPNPGDYPPVFETYIGKVAHEDAVEALRSQLDAMSRLARLTPEQAAFRYAEGKWSVGQVIGHIADAERVFSYRMMRAARGDRTPLQSFDENAYVVEGAFDARTIEDLAGELVAVRQSTLALVSSLDEPRLARTTVAGGRELSVRVLAFVMAGHAAHHLALLRDRYRVDV